MTKTTTLRAATAGALLCATLATGFTTAPQRIAPDEALSAHFALLTDVSTALAPVGDTATTALRGKKSKDSKDSKDGDKEKDKEEKAKLHGKKAAADAGLDKFLAHKHGKVPGSAHKARVDSLKGNVARLVDAADEAGAEQAAADLTVDVREFLYDTSAELGFDAAAQPAAEQSAATTTSTTTTTTTTTTTPDHEQNFTLVTAVSEALAPVGEFAGSVLAGGTDQATLDAQRAVCESELGELDNLLGGFAGGSPYRRAAASELLVTVRAVRAHLAALASAPGTPGQAAVDLDADTGRLLFQTSVRLGHRPTR